MEYGIEVSQATIENVDPEENFKKLLALQRDAAGKSNVARQEAQKAEFEKQKIVAQGETQKAEIRVEKEKEQINILIEAETEMKKQKTVVEQQKFAVQAEQLRAQATKIRADAEAYERERKMKADHALELRLSKMVEINKVWAEALKGSQMVPTYYFGGGGAGSGNAVDNFVRLMTANAAQQINAAMKEK